MLKAKTHADASPSSSNIWIACPASVTKARGRVRKSTPYTREGTAAHTMAETILKDLDQDDIQTIEVEGETIHVTDEMRDTVEKYVTHVINLPGRIHVESKVKIPVDGEDIFGTVDAWTESKGIVYVRDFKYGQGHAVSPDCSQLRIYGLGVVNELGPFPGVETVSLGIVQPRTDPQPKIVEIPLNELLAWEEDILKPAVRKLAADDRTENPGDHCRWCVRAAECKSLALLAQDAAKVAFDAVPPEPETLSTAELASVLAVAEIIASWVSKVRAEAMTRADRGDVVPGWKLVPKRASRKWADPQGMIDVLAGLQGVSAADILRIETITNVERALKKAGYKPASVTDAYTIKESSGNTLVSENDPRKTLDISARDVFQIEFDET